MYFYVLPALAALLRVLIFRPQDDQMTYIC